MSSPTVPDDNRKNRKSENTNMKERLEGKIVGEGKPIRIHILVFPRIFAQSLSID
jgi:hypothetical protein